MTAMLENKNNFNSISVYTETFLAMR